MMALFINDGENMCILMIGALTIQYVKENWVLPLKEKFDAHFVDVSPILQVYGKDYCEQYLYGVIRNQTYDCIFFYPDSIQTDFSNEFFETIRKCNIPIVTFYADDEPDVWFEQNRNFDIRFSLIATHSQAGLAKRIGHLQNVEMLYLPWGFNPRICKRLETEKQYDVVYFGLNSASTENPNLYLRDGFVRQQTLVEAYLHCKENGYSFAVFGGGWERHPILKECAQGIVSSEEMIRIFNQARIVLNPGYSADNRLDGYQTKLRHFEVAGCGVFQLTNYNPELKELFCECKSIVFFHNYEELRKQITYYLNFPKERELIAENAFRTAHQNHTMYKRIERLFDKVKSLWPQYSLQSQRISVHIHTQDVTQGKLSITKTKQDDWVHFTSHSQGLRNLEYSNINFEKVIKNEKRPIVFTRCFLEFGTLHNDPIQRRRQNIVGTILPETIQKCHYDKWLIKYLRESFICLENESQMILLDNMLIPIERLEEIYEVIETKNLDMLLTIPSYYCGMIVSDHFIQHDCPVHLLEPPYLSVLRRLLDNCRYVKERVLLYGGRGYMAEDVYRLLHNYPMAQILGVVDRSLECEPILGMKVYRHKDIEHLNPSVIIIMADISGPSIYQSIIHVQPRIQILPLYDLTHPSWNLVLP